MRTIRVAARLAGAALLLAGAMARAQCLPNALGGPSQLTLVVGGIGSDIDVGWRSVHNLPVPQGASIGLCLQGCGTSSDPVCTVAGAASVAGDLFGPPLPVNANGIPICLVTRVARAADGTADLETGTIDVSLGLGASTFVTSFTELCPRCGSGAVGEPGTCDSGVRQGMACIVDDVVTAADPVGSPDYSVSADCLPSGVAAGTLSLDLTLTTGSRSLASPCADQAGANECAGTCTGGCSAAANAGGVPQLCCSDAADQPCFPAAIERTGAPGAPAPAWPNASYPKDGQATLVDAVCSPGTGDPALDLVIGLPGPVAMILPVTHSWALAPTTTTSSVPPPTTTTSAPPGGASTTTLPPGACVREADCVDHDPCTEDVCTAGACRNPPLGGFAGADCEVREAGRAPLCSPLDPKLQTFVAAQLDRIGRLLTKAAGPRPAGRRARLLDKVRRALRRIDARTKRFLEKDRVTMQCADAILDAVGTMRRAIDAIRI